MRERGENFAVAVAADRAQRRLYPAISAQGNAAPPEGARAADAGPLFPDSRVDAWRPARRCRGRMRRAGAGDAQRRFAPRPGQAPFRARKRQRPYFAFDPRGCKALTGSPASKLSMIRVEGRFDGADAERRRRYPGRPGRWRRTAARRDLCAAGRRDAAGQAAGDPPGRPPGDRPVRQSGLCRLARLRAGRDRLHRPGDLGWAEDRAEAVSAGAGRPAR